MKIALIGGRGHASDVLGAIEAANLWDSEFQIVGIVADGDLDMNRFAHRGVEHIGGMDDLRRLDVTHFIGCVGYPEGRRVVTERALACGLEPVPAIVHPKAWVHPHVTLGHGSVILAFACISAGASIGAHACISNGALIGHDCQAADYVSVMPGAAVSGDTFLNEGCMIGTNATVLEKLTVGAWARIGAGAVVTKNVPPRVTATGIPARF